MHDERTCVVPENIYTPSTEDHWKFPGEGGSKAVISEGWGGGVMGKHFLKGDRPRTKH